MDVEIQRLLGLLVQGKAVVVSGGVRKNDVVGEGVPYWRVPHFTAIVNGNHGTAQNDVETLSVPGVINTALSFDGFVELPA